MDALLRRAVAAAEISPLSGSERLAAVAIVLAGDGHELLLIRRADDPRDPWSGHMALPGGRHEHSDADLLETATRETREEVGISLSSDHYLGPLPRVHARNRSKTNPLWVAPFVFHISGSLPQTVPNYEVAEVVWVPLMDLVKPERRTTVDVAHEGNNYSLPAWQVEGGKVWGLTYMILKQLFGLLDAVRESPAQEEDAPRITGP